MPTTSKEKSVIVLETWHAIQGLLSPITERSVESDWRLRQSLNRAGQDNLWQQPTPDGYNLGLWATLAEFYYQSWNSNCYPGQEDQERLEAMTDNWGKDFYRQTISCYTEKDKPMTLKKVRCLVAMQRYLGGIGENSYRQQLQETLIDSCERLPSFHLIQAEPVAEYLIERFGSGSETSAGKAYVEAWEQREKMPANGKAVVGTWFAMTEKCGLSIKYLAQLLRMAERERWDMGDKNKWAEKLNQLMESYRFESPEERIQLQESIQSLATKWQLEDKIPPEKRKPMINNIRL